MNYAPHGSHEFNARLDATLRRLTADMASVLGSNMQALVLGGGYGRGEGAVVRRLGREYPYNDLDLVLIVHHKHLVNHPVVEGVASAYANELQIEVDFSRPLTIRGIRRWPHTLMWHDLLAGHVVLAGSRHVLDMNAPPVIRRNPPLIEGTRLLLNRGAGLLWAERVQRQLDQPPDADFVRRNYYKCVQALGDSLLLAHQVYTTSYAGRDTLLARLSKKVPSVGAFEIQPRYAEALRFKFLPDNLPAEVSEHAIACLAKRWGEVFLYVEQLRTGTLFTNLADYAEWTGLREPDQHGVLLLARNIVHNQRIGRWSWRYPRERLYRELPSLLHQTDTHSRAWSRRSSAFLRVWRRFN